MLLRILTSCADTPELQHQPPLPLRPPGCTQGSGHPRLTKYAICKKIFQFFVDFLNLFQSDCFPFFSVSGKKTKFIQLIGALTIVDGFWTSPPPAAELWCGIPRVCAPDRMGGRRRLITAVAIGLLYTRIIFHSQVAHDIFIAPHVLRLMKNQISKEAKKQFEFAKIAGPMSTESYLRIC